jgi:hypothetical protein
MYTTGAVWMPMSKVVLEAGKVHNVADCAGARFQAAIGDAGGRVMYLQLLYRALGWPADQTTSLR